MTSSVLSANSDPARPNDYPGDLEGLDDLIIGSTTLLSLARASSPLPDQTPAQQAKQTKRREQRELLADQSQIIADRLHRLGVDPYRRQSLTAVGTDTLTADRTLRSWTIFPVAQSQQRLQMEMALSLFLASHRRHARYARYAVLTGGKRVPPSGIRDRKRAIEKAISRWREYCDSAGYRIHLIFASYEEPVANGLVHVHCNLIYAPMRYLEEHELIDAMARLRHYLGGANVHDAGRLKKVKEAIKYVTKPNEIGQMTDGDFMDFFSANHRLKLLTPLGDFRSWKSRIEENHRITSCRGRPVLLQKIKRPKSSEEKDESRYIETQNYVIGLAAKWSHERGVSEPVVRVLGYTRTPDNRIGQIRLARIDRILAQARWITDKTRDIEAGGGGWIKPTQAVERAIKAAAIHFGGRLDGLFSQGSRVAVLGSHVQASSQADPLAPSSSSPPHPPDGPVLAA